MEEVSTVKEALDDAGAARDVAGDGVRRLRPVVTAAKNSERGDRP